MNLIKQGNDYQSYIAVVDSDGDKVDMQLVDNLHIVLNHAGFTINVYDYSFF